MSTSSEYKDRTPDFFFHFFSERRGIGHHALEAKILADALYGVQRSVYLIAMAREQREIRQRARIPKDIEKIFPIVCLPAEEGSYSLPFSIGLDNPSLVQFDSETIEIFVEDIKSILSAISKGDDELFESIVPRLQYRQLIVDSIKKSFPKTETGVSFSILDKDRRTIFSGRKSESYLASFNALQLPEDRFGVITGHLRVIDLGANSIKIQHPVSERMLECYYREEIEPLLLDNPRELIQVIGRIEFDSNDNSHRIVDVQDIISVELDELEIAALYMGNQKIVAKEPLLFSPSLDETMQLFVLKYEDLGIDIAALTRSDLEEMLVDEMKMLWAEFAIETDSKLTRDGLGIKRKMLELFEVSPDAT